MSEHDARDHWAWMFPGQGGQFVGMSRALFGKYPQARAIAEEAEAVAGLPLARLARQGPAAELARPEVLEPWLAATSIAYVDILHDAGLRPSAVAGFSAGEVGALYAAGVLTRGDALRVACWRGELLRGAAETFPGGMNAVLGLDTRVVRRAAADGGGRVAIAAINAPRHLTITGVDADLDRLARTLARAGGALHPVDVAGPWHGPWLLSAADTLAARLATIPFHRPAVLVYSGVHGRIEDDPDRLRAGLAAQLHAPIRWKAIVDDQHQRGCRRFLEVGAGRVLRDLVRRNPPDATGDRVEGVEGHDGGDGPLRRLTNPRDSRSPALSTRSLL